MPRPHGRECAAPAQSGEFAVLDFGDAVLAPACVELPSLVLEGLAADADAAAGVFGGWDAADAVEALLDGLSLLLPLTQGGAVNRI